MFDLVPVDHDPFADPPFKLIPVDHDPFAVGSVAQPADPAMAAATAPQLVPVDHDPFAAAPADALPRIIVHPGSPNAPPENPAGADGVDDWFVPTADGYPDDWFVPAPVATPGQSGLGAQSNAAAPPVSNPPAVRPDPSAAYWSLIPASRAGAFAWHPPIFLNSAGQFPPPAPAYDPPILPAGGLFGSIGRKLAASVNGPGIGYGLFGNPVRLPAVSTDAPPSILGAGSNSAPSSIYPPYLGGSALPSYLADTTTPPNQSPLASLTQFLGPAAAGASRLGSWNSPSAIPFQAPVTAAPPTRSVLFDQAPVAWDPGAPDRNAANLEQTARTLGVSDLPLSKSGAPVVSPPPRLTITPQQSLDVAHLVSPNLVDYFTKTLPPAPPLPSTPGKIPSSDNPYGPGAAFEGATWLLGGLERGIVGPLEGVASTAERSGTETALEAARGAIYVPASNRTTEQIVTGPYGKLTGTLPRGFQANHLNQNRVYDRFIPKKEGFSVSMRGDIIAEPGTPHYKYHRSLEQFWDQYRVGERLESKLPTNAEYGEAVKRALIAAGLSPALASDFAEQAAAQRVASGLSESAAVPRIPGAIWPRRRR